MNVFICIFLSIFTVVQLNCENFFDCKHDSLKQDYDFLPTGIYRWTPHRYWNKLTHISQEIVSCGNRKGQWNMPDLVALCEVENDSVLQYLTQRSLLRTARYQYVITHSPDIRGINVALLYSPFTFSVLSSYSLPIILPKNTRPTRDILYVSGRIVSGDTLHVFVVHAPSKRGGEKKTLPFREKVCSVLAQAVDSLQAKNKDVKVLILGDFNDNSTSKAFLPLKKTSLINISAQAKGVNAAKGTYKFKGEWTNLDHMFITKSLFPSLLECTINDASFLLIADLKYGGFKPFRCYIGPKYSNGFSDHLPLVAFFSW